MDVVTLGAALSIMKKMPDTAASSAAAAEDAADRAEEAARTLTIDDTLTKPGQPADSKAVGDTLAEKLDIADLPDTVNNANQLLSEKYVIDTEPYHLRPSGGQGADREFDTIVGGSVVWNQQIDDEHYSGSSGVSITKNNHEFSIVTTGSAQSLSFNVNNKIQGHVYLVSAYISSENNHDYLRVRFGSGTNGSYIDFFNLSGTKTNYAGLMVADTYETTRISFNMISGDTYIIGTPQFFDLTQMFGSEIADYIYSLEQATAGAGVAWFRKYFPNDYYEYNSGELMHVNDLQSHDMVGFNQWDEEWEVGGIDNTTGAETTSTTIKRSKNYIHVFPNTEYHSSAVGTLGLRYYDANRNFVGSTTVASNSKFVTPSKATYLRLVTATITTADSPVCINLSWSGTRNGEYEPYAKHSYPLDSSLTLRGVPMLTADGDLTYDGDIYKPDGTVERRYGIVDLGTLNWVYRNSGYNVKPFLANLSGTVVPAASTIVIPAFCEKYLQVVPKKLNVSGADKIFSIGMYFSNQHNINIVDTDYTDATSFKNAMSGVYLIYPLATPTTETATPYTSPQIVDPYGTEEYVTTSIVPVGHQTKYPENLRAKIEGLPWNFASLIAPVEAEFKATRNYTSGSLFIVNNTLYKATANIANGGSITPNTNCTATTLAEIIAAF